MYTLLVSILWSAFLGTKLVPSDSSSTVPTLLVPSHYAVASTQKSRMVNCCLRLESKKQTWIDQWLELDAPLLDAVVREVSVASNFEDSQILYSYQYSLIFVVKHLNSKEWAQTDWYCNDSRNIALKQTASNCVHLIQCTFNATIPPDIELQQPLLHSVWPSKLVGLRNFKPSSSDSTLQQLPASHSQGVKVRYDKHISAFLDCDHSEEEHHEEGHVQAKRSPSIGSCIIIRDNLSLLPAWIEYHRLMGVEHFWVFVNQPWQMEIPATIQSPSGRYERPYITYMPYNFYWGDHYNHSKHHKPARDIFWQEAMQMKCLYNAKRLGLDWITTTDVDEYIFVNDSSYHFEGAGTNEWDNLDLPRREFPLQSFLRDHEEDFSPLAAVAMNSVFFGRNVQTEGVPPPDMMFFHYIHRPTDPFWSRWKQIYRVENANVAGVHEVLAARKSESTRLDQVYFQHYKKPHKGVFWTDKNNITRDSRMRDIYLESVMAAVLVPNTEHTGA